MNLGYARRAISHPISCREYEAVTLHDRDRHAGKVEFTPTGLDNRVDFSSQFAGANTLVRADGICDQQEVTDMRELIRA
jgi:hypothetical protein